MSPIVNQLARSYRFEETLQGKIEKMGNGQKAMG
jgi:hypothetical protein